MPRIEPPTITALKLTDLPRGRRYAIPVQTGGAMWYAFALSFKDAADRLAELAANDPGRWGSLAAPCLFLYRHHVELHLKSLLLDAGELLDDPQVVPPKHYLLSLWERVRKLLLRIDSRSDDPYMARAAAIVGELDAIDPTSFAFRYPVDTVGAPFLPRAFEVDALNLRSVIAELHLIMNGASTQIDVYMDYKNIAY